ncbi:hypothetical protein GGF50DRAFT_67989, partial [Schizophyllum commune]
MTTGLAQCLVPHGKRPTITDGTLVPTIIQQWQWGAKDYLEAKGITDPPKPEAGEPDDAPKVEVRAVAGGLVHYLLAAEYRSHQDRYDSMRLDEFCTTIASEVLGDWQQKKRTDILHFEQPENLPIRKFINGLRNENLQLQGSTHHIDDRRLREAVQSNCARSIRPSVKARELTLDAIPLWDQWFTTMETVEREARAQVEALRAEVALQMAASTRRTYDTAFAGNKAAPRPSVPRTGTNTSAGSAARYPPKLTQEEKDVLFEHKGCFNCRKINTGHISKDCPDDPPSPIGYEKRTEAWARANGARPKQTVAAVGEGGGVLADASPLAYPHLMWQPLVLDDESGFPAQMNALIDHGCHHGCHLVLVSDDASSRLHLPCHRLASPITVTVAIDSAGKKKEFSLVEFVYVKLYDKKRRWSSKAMRALVSPGLCTDMICGLPFLVQNNLVVDAAARTCVDSTCGFDLMSGDVPEPRA